MAKVSKKIFVDSSTFIAFIDRASDNHYKAIEGFQKLAQEGFQVFTSNLVLSETYDKLRTDLGGSTAQEFLQTLFVSEIGILESSRSDLQSALKLLAYYGNRDIGVSEALNAIVMSKRAIPQVYSFSYWNNLLGTSAYLFTEPQE